ncbi:MAG: hypothetical protein ABIN58_00370 [candidate division WOR-3 bacterium]
MKSTMIRVFKTVMPIVLALLLTATDSFSGRDFTSALVLPSNSLYLSSDQEQQSGNDVEIPGDTQFRLELLSPISTASNKKGDQFTCRVLEPSEYANAIVIGHIAKIKRSGNVKGKSEIALAFDSITLPDGHSGRFYAQITEVYDVVGAGKGGRADEEGVVQGKSLRKRDGITIGIASAVGAIVGGILGGKEGAVIGASIGAAIGVTTTLATKGPDMEFKDGAQFTVQTGTPARQSG